MTLFPTAVIGSLPRSTPVLELVTLSQHQRLAPAERDRYLDAAISFAVVLQELAGIDIITDGEWRRLAFFDVIAHVADRGNFTEESDDVSEKLRIVPVLNRITPNSPG